ncbi:hypothetical protein ACDF64_01630 [Agromyces sp. MMS24-JH15]|uniref:hypothetical protein n=1 Tax=Agromyces sp. MMS24-JH15 TaxID=3243765 RepID=UPI003747DD55
MRNHWKATAVAVLVVGSSLVAMPAYAADLSCNSDLGDQTVTGNLVVGAGANCVLGGATVLGDITVQAGGWLDATSVVVEGDVVATDAYGVSIDGTSVGGDISVYSANTPNGFLYLNDLEVGGSVAAGGVDVEVTDSTIGGSLTTQDAFYVDVIRTSVVGDVSIDGSNWGVSVLGAIVQGDVTVSGSSRDVLIGATAGGGADAFGNTIGGDLVLTGNTANLQVASTTVQGAIELADNDPAATFGAGVAASSVTGAFTGTPAGQPAAGDQAIAVTVPAQAPGELIWSLDGTSALVDLGVAEEELNGYVASGSIVPIRVQDTRAGNPSWTLTAQVSNFAAGGQTISSRHLGWGPKVGENGGGAVPGAAVAPGTGETDGLAVARTLASAPAGHARAASVVGADLALELPLDTPRGTYTATVTLTALS